MCASAPQLVCIHNANANRVSAQAVSQREANRIDPAAGIVRPHEGTLPTLSSRRSGATARASIAELMKVSCELERQLVAISRSAFETLRARTATLRARLVQLGVIA